MAEQLRFENMSVQEIGTALEADLVDLTAEQALAVRHFVEKIGGIENAMLAVEMLGDMEGAP